MYKSRNSRIGRKPQEEIHLILFFYFHSDSLFHSGLTHRSVAQSISCQCPLATTYLTL